MIDNVNRRDLTKIAGALAGTAVAAGLAPAAAQEATPAAMNMQAVEEIVSAWPDVPREVAQTVMEKYGPPQEGTPSRLIWFDNGPWKRHDVPSRLAGSA